jgi:hypothetical protein
MINPIISPRTCITLGLLFGGARPICVNAVRSLADWAEADAFQTTANMAALVKNGFAGKAVDLAFCVGDLSYATGFLGKWETFMNAIGPVSSRVPYMVGQGNHEQDWYHRHFAHGVLCIGMHCVCDVCLPSAHPTLTPDITIPDPGTTQARSVRALGLSLDEIPVANVECRHLPVSQCHLRLTLVTSNTGTTGGDSCRKNFTTTLSGIPSTRDLFTSSWPIRSSH